jgi:hypothetical protein
MLCQLINQLHAYKNPNVHLRVTPDKMICSQETSSFSPPHHQSSVNNIHNSLHQRVKAKIYQALGKLNPQSQAKSEPSNRHPSVLPHSFLLPHVPRIPSTHYPPPTKTFHFAILFILSHNSNQKPFPSKLSINTHSRTIISYHQLSPQNSN